MTKKTTSSISVTPLNFPPSYTMTELFEHYADNSWAMLLDSSDGEHEDGCFDILVTAPIATITNAKNKCALWQQTTNKTVQQNGNPITLMQCMHKKYFAHYATDSIAHLSLPFLCGAMGYFGYDLARHFEHLPDNRADEYQAPDMAVGLYSWSIIRDKHSNQFYLCAADDLPHPSIQQLESQAKKASPEESFTLTSDWQANMTQAEYEHKLVKIADYLRAGDCYQINLAQRFEACYQGDEWAAFKRLREANLAPFSAFIRLTNSVIMSISPERFLAVKDKQVQTKPIKGTRPRGENPAEDQQQIESLMTSDKDKAENLMIVDLLRNDLSKHCLPGTVDVPALFKIESFAAVHHLVSTVTGNLKPHSSPMDLLQGAFPGGSITGAPKIRAMQIIDELEPNKRNIYCGSIGYLGIKGDLDTSICIRTLLCERSEQQNHIYCWAGGGIVIDSEASSEYQESLDKVTKILPVLAQHKKDNLSEVN